VVVLAVGTAVVWADITAIDEPASATEVAVRLTTTTAAATTTTLPLPANRSLRFFGTGSGDVDRVKVPISATTAVNVGAGDFTIEFWIKGTLADNPNGVCNTGNDAWINGHVAIDRDVYGGGDYGDYGISLMNGRVAFGASSGGSGATVCGSTNVLDGAWHNVAVTRAVANGKMVVFVDGAIDGQNSSSAADGDLSYRVGRSTPYPADPFLVFGAEKHDAGSAYPSFDGWLDEVRVSTTIRYTGAFTRPTARLTVDGATAALYHFDEGAGLAVGDAAGTSPGQRRVHSGSGGPLWSTDVPFA